jgi:hypothetical protein
MARIRYVKQGLFHNEELSDCDPLARMLFIGLWTEADREGRLADRPKKIKAILLPYDDCDIEVLLNQLHEKEFIVRYTVNDEAFIQVNNFSKHQNPHPKEAPSEIPPPPNEPVPAIIKEYVYFIRCEATGMIKLGKAQDPIARLRALQTGSASELVLVGAIEGGFDREKELHERFAHLKTRGEWFKPETELLDWIRVITNPDEKEPIPGIAGNGEKLPATESNGKTFLATGEQCRNLNSNYDSNSEGNLDSKKTSTATVRARTIPGNDAADDSFSRAGPEKKNGNGKGGKSRFDEPLCREFVELVVCKQRAVHNPGGLAHKIYETGNSDRDIQAWLDNGKQAPRQKRKAEIPG